MCNVFFGTIRVVWKDMVSFSPITSSTKWMVMDLAVVVVDLTMMVALMVVAMALTLVVAMSMAI